MAEETKIAGTSAAGQGASTDTNTVGSESKQTSHDETNGNSGSSDRDNGTESNDKERTRPSRAERRINELSIKLRGKDDLAEENARLRTLLEKPLAAGSVNLPDRSGQDEITPEQYKQDIITAADQIVKLRLDGALTANNQRLSQSQLNERAIGDMEAAVSKYPELNPDNEKYDPDLETFIAETFERGFKADSSYRFEDLVKQTLKLRGSSSSTNDDERDNRSSGAIKGSGGGTKGTKDINSMTTAELEAHIHNMNGRRR